MVIAFTLVMTTCTIKIERPYCKEIKTFVLWRLNPYWLKGNLPLDRLFCKYLLWHFFHLILVLNFVSCLDIRSPGWTSLSIPPVEFYSCSPLSTLWMMFSSFWKEMYLIYIPLYISYTWKSLEQTALLDKNCCILLLINTFSPYIFSFGLWIHVPENNS